MISCLDARDQKKPVFPDGPHLEEGLDLPSEGDLAHHCDVADLQEGGVGLLGGGKNNSAIFLVHSI